MNANEHANEHDEREGACPSQYQLDRMSAGELTDLERVRLDHHVAGCPACERALAQRAEERARFVPDPRLLARLEELPQRAEPAARVQPTALPATARRPTAWPATRWRRPAIALAPLALAAGVLLLAQARGPTPPAIDRRATGKGGALARVVVERGGERWELAPAGRVQPGDRLQVTVRLPDERFVAVYSLDGAGAVSRYAPIDAPMVALAPGGEQELPNSTILDEVLGRETLAVFACEQDQGDAALRAHVRHGTPAGCEVSRIELIKEAP